MATTDIAIRDTDSWTGVLEPARTLSTDIASTEFVPAAMRGNPHKVLAAVLTGRELGLGPMQALSSIDVIEGKTSLSAKAMLALIRQAGHQVRTVESGNQRCTLKARRAEDRDDPEAWETFTYPAEEARQAGLLGKKNWERYRQDMLLARTVTRMARFLFSDVIMGLETAEIVMDGDSDTAVLSSDLVEAQEVAAPSTLRTIKKPAAAKTATRQRQVKSQAAKPSLSLADIEDSSVAPQSEAAEGVVRPAAPHTDDQDGEVEAPGATTTPPSPSASDAEIIDAEIVDQPEMITAAQLRKLHAVLTEAGMGAVKDRDQAIQFYQDVTGDQTIGSSKDLTMAQAMRVIDALEAIANPSQEPPADGAMFQEGDPA